MASMLMPCPIPYLIYQTLSCQHIAGHLRGQGRGGIRAGALPYDLKHKPYHASILQGRTGHLRGQGRGSVSAGAGSAAGQARVLLEQLQQQWVQLGAARLAHLRQHALRGNKGLLSVHKRAASPEDSPRPAKIPRQDF